MRCGRFDSFLRWGLRVCRLWGGGGARSGGFTRFALLGVAASRVQGFGSKVVRLKFRNLALRLDLGARGKVEGSG